MTPLRTIRFASPQANMLLAVTALLALALPAAPAWAESPPGYASFRSLAERAAGAGVESGRYRAAQLDGVSDPSGDAADPRGDITGVVVDNATDDDNVLLGIEVEQADRYTSGPWTFGFTGIVWGIDIDGDGDRDWAAGIVSGERGAQWFVNRDGASSPACSGEPVVNGRVYGMIFRSSCIGSPASVAVQAYFSYDTDYDCATCPTSEDITVYTSDVPRGSERPEPSPAASPAPSSPAASPAPSGSGSGYWFVAADGGVFAYGGAPFHGSATGEATSPVVGLAASPDGGYWIVEANGRVHSRGVTHFGDLAGMQLNSPIVGIAATPSGRGYYLLGRDGGVFTFGDAAFHGSTGGTRLNQPVIAMATR